MSMTTCCDIDSTRTEDVEEMHSDPTLMSCCERDDMQRRAVAKMKSRLLEMDPSGLRRQLEGRSIVVLAPAGDTKEEQEEEEEEDWDDLDDEVLQRLRATRLGEMMAKKAATQTRTRGAGQCTEVSDKVAEDIILKGLTDEKASGIVCHWVLEGAPECDAVAASMDALAWRNQQTRFLYVRQKGRRGGRLLASMRIPSAPAIIVVRGGVVVGHDVGYASFGGVNDFREEKMQGWLARMGVVEKSGDGEESEEEEEEGAPCALCGRSYPHEHIRAVFGSNREESEESDTESDVD